MTTNPKSTDTTTAADWPPLQKLALSEDTALPALLQPFRDTIAQCDRLLKARFTSGEQVATLVADRARLIDALLVRVWQRCASPATDGIELIAVGGYGRGELHPGSDIDIMILLPDAHNEQWRESVGTFLTFLWDIGLEVGHSVRTVADCLAESRADITVATSLMESRPLFGQTDNFKRMWSAVGPDRVWPSRAFFEAKLGEQAARHRRYDDTAYKLEPNIKGSPGGLRDIQMIGWVAKRHFGVRTMQELIDLEFLTEQEYQRLRAGRQFLWKLRFALHMLTGRREDRLLFDHQARIAEMLGYTDSDHNLAVEQLMQRYYRTVMELGLLNEMLLQLFREAILMDPMAAATPLNDRFHIHNGYLAASDDSVFERSPGALLEVFALLQANPELHGVSASTIRQLRLSLHQIDDEFRADPGHRAQFMSILRSPRMVTHALQRMNAYGVLGRYVPAFGQIVGRMQYDLFHTYTVDAHTLFVLRNLRGFALNEPDPVYPHCAQIMQGLPKPELAYLAALFHDIAKGRGGDHSELGAEDAENFCLDHGLSAYEARLVAWLVRNHLILSVTAQKKDIDDPQEIHDFATTVGDEQHLEYLYVLTVADVNGTNPQLWTSWKASLFEELFLLTRRALRRGLGNPIDKETLIRETQTGAAELLADRNVSRSAMGAVWDRFPDGYFLRHSAQEIAWHTRLLADHPAGLSTPLVAVDPASARGGTSIFVYSPQHAHTFARTTAVLDELGFNILDARISRTRDGTSVETFMVTEATGEAIADPDRADAIAAGLSGVLAASGAKRPDVTRRAPRQVRMFSTPTQIAFNEDTNNKRTIMELTAGDRPGLLSQIGHTFMTHGIVIETAKITTVGERAEDVFYITGANGGPLKHGQCDSLLEELTATLDPAVNPDLDKLFSYPFTRLDELKAGLTPPAAVPPISLAIGEPRHSAPAFVLDALALAGRNLGLYPQAAGIPELRQACGHWLKRRYAVSVDADTMILPLSGTREGLFAFAQSVIDRGRDAAVLMPNPFYQIYEGAALMAGAEPVYLNALPENNFLPDLDAVAESTWKRCQLLYTCSPGNPTGAVMDLDYLGKLIELALRYDFIIAADECYAEIYLDEDNPPPGLLQASAASGEPGFRNCVVFHSLSKRSNVPGLRSGFIAGDAEIIRQFRLYRSYHGCAMPVHHQLASVAAWNDDLHVHDNRDLYREKFATAGRRIAALLDCEIPPAAFYLWAATPIDDENFAARLYNEHNVTVLPGSYLARDTANGNPGRNRVRISLVAGLAECIEAAERMAGFVNSL